MIKILLGGSPCTYWNIAQNKDKRETQAEGMGWELFKNYLIAKEKFKPNFFLYENNKSAAQAIKDQICEELGAPLMYINSALVSAQNRQRFYVFNWQVEQPQDRGILLKDVLNITTDLNINAPHNVGCYPRPNGEIKNGQGYLIYDVNGKAITQTAQSGGIGTNTGLYAIPINTYNDAGEKSRTVLAGYYKFGNATIATNKSFKGGATALLVPKIEKPNGKIFKVENGVIDYGGRKCPIKLADGEYIIRKLTPIECERLQTMPDNYTEGVSNSQRYKCLGNGWTAEVIIHILNGALKDVPRDEEIQVLSMYDGIGTGRYCLDKMGFTNVKYYAYEIDKYAVQIAKKNYADIIELGDAFQLRSDDWRLPNE